MPLLLATIGAAGALAVGGVAAAVLILVTGVLVFALQRQRRRPRNPSVSIPQAGERQKS
ncbi:MAG: hypothetical protein IVW52_16415 [Acidimicrobiales bacterium]|nr:hypothetical protein [Acidimicrobiales bacterium]